jgi:hypothetical protein
MDSTLAKAPGTDVEAAACAAYVGTNQWPPSRPTVDISLAREPRLPDSRAIFDSYAIWQ